MISYNQEMTMLGFISVKVVLGILIGAGIGYGYYRLVGCSTGTCPITSNPWISSIYGAVMGIFITMGGK